MQQAGVLQSVEVTPLDPRRFVSVLNPGEYEALLDLIERSVDVLGGRVVWNVNSTAAGGGVAELLRPLVGYARGAGADVRWAVISAEPAFFEITKRIHNHLHGMDRDGGELGAAERSVYERGLSANAAELVSLIKPADVVILHDPQTAGMLEAVHAAGATVIWRCHIGLDEPDERMREAWRFLLPYVANAHAFVFSRASFVWEGLEREKVFVIRPSIDAFSPKNQEQSPEQSLSILAGAGIASLRSPVAPVFERYDGTPGRVRSRAAMVEEAPLAPADRVVAQISRWDLLKDPLGVLTAFAQIADQTDVHLLLAGPATESVRDDPEQASVFNAVRDGWRTLPVQVRRRVHLASLPMDDADENAAIVNAAQRRAEIIVQKSLAEGFGLTVTEAMWKERPVVASRIGGIRDQIADGESGILISDPRDLREFASAVSALLAEPERGRRIGVAARARVREHFLGPQHLGRFFEVIEELLARRAAERQVRGAPRRPTGR
jgi:trehalose synthase